MLPEVLPDRFTVEFDYVSNNKASSGWPILVNTSGAKDNWQSQGTFNPTARFGTQEGGVYSGKIEASGPGGRRLPGQGEPGPDHGGREVHQGLHQRRPGGERTQRRHGPHHTVQFWIPVYDQTGASVTLLGPIRIAAGGKKLYDALAEKGRVATQGIYFDTGSDAIRQESAPTLKEIGTMLKDHADLKLTIEGHTDNVGKAAVQPGAQREAGGGGAPVPDRQLPDRGGPAGGQGPRSDQAGGLQRLGGRPPANRRVELVKK